MIGEGCHVGHVDSLVSHDGPDDHSVEDFSWQEVSPLVRRLARLSSVGQYFDILVLLASLISVIR